MHHSMPPSNDGKLWVFCFQYYIHLPTESVSLFIDGEMDVERYDGLDWSSLKLTDIGFKQDGEFTHLKELLTKFFFFLK